MGLIVSSSIYVALQLRESSMAMATSADPDTLSPRANLASTPQLLPVQVAAESVVEEEEPRQPLEVKKKNQKQQQQQKQTKEEEKEEQDQQDQVPEEQQGADSLDTTVYRLPASRSYPPSRQAANRGEESLVSSSLSEKTQQKQQQHQQPETEKGQKWNARRGVMEEASVADVLGHEDMSESLFASQEDSSGIKKRKLRSLSQSQRADRPDVVLITSSSSSAADTSALSTFVLTLDPDKEEEEEEEEEQTLSRLQLLAQKSRSTANVRRDDEDEDEDEDHDDEVIDNPDDDSNYDDYSGRAGNGKANGGKGRRRPDQNQGISTPPHGHVGGGQSRHHSSSDSDADGEKAKKQKTKSKSKGYATTDDPVPGFRSPLSTPASALPPPPTAPQLCSSKSCLPKLRDLILTRLIDRVAAALQPLANPTLLLHNLDSTAPPTKEYLMTHQTELVAQLQDRIVTDLRNWVLEDKKSSLASRQGATKEKTRRAKTAHSAEHPGGGTDGAESVQLLPPPTDSQAQQQQQQHMSEEQIRQAVTTTLQSLGLEDANDHGPGLSMHAIEKDHGHRIFHPNTVVVARPPPARAAAPAAARPASSGRPAAVGTNKKTSNGSNVRSSAKKHRRADLKHPRTGMKSSQTSDNQQNRADLTNHKRTGYRRRGSDTIKAYRRRKNSTPPAEVATDLLTRPVAISKRDADANTDANGQQGAASTQEPKSDKEEDTSDTDTSPTKAKDNVDEDESNEADSPNDGDDDGSNNSNSGTSEPPKEGDQKSHEGPEFFLSGDLALMRQEWTRWIVHWVHHAKLLVVAHSLLPQTLYQMTQVAVLGGNVVPLDQRHWAWNLDKALATVLVEAEWLCGPVPLSSSPRPAGSTTKSSSAAAASVASSKSTKISKTGLDRVITAASSPPSSSSPAATLKVSPVNKMHAQMCINVWSEDLEDILQKTVIPAMPMASAPLA
ncbi:hypothetical protein BGZ73_004974 [Actinomortierella ambigua]|nr:hypothetical protein BGZ73_004974 [Actinomortierella ambigua]